jgi:hypothetical protein
MARRTIGKPRFYADVLQYLKVLGYHESNDNPELWNLDPTNNNEYNEATHTFNFKEDSAISKLVTAIPQSDVSGVYAGVLGHNLDTNDTISFSANDSDFTATQIVNCTGGNTPEYNGYSLVNITEGAEDIFSQINLNVTSSESKKLGSITFGRWFEPEFAFEIQASVSNNFEGIKTQTTIGGHSITNINHLGQPNWANGLPAWALKKQDNYDYNLGGKKGRRQWEVGLSYLSDDKLFNKADNPDEFFTYDEDEDTHTFDTSLASFYKLTLNGKLPFIFTPDFTTKEFAICRITNKPSFKQVANNLFSTSLVLTETW